MKKKFRIIKFKKNRPALQIKSVSKSFSGRPVLKKINLEVSPGEILGLVGPNGSGKTTLFNLIIGQTRVDSGTIFLGSKDITEKPIHERAKLGIAYLSQYRNVFNMSVYDNLMGICQLSIKNEQKQKEIVEKLLSEFQLEHLRSLNSSVLSGGEVRRLQIARTLINNPKVSPSVQLGAINSLLDRSGYQTITKIEDETGRKTDAELREELKHLLSTIAIVRGPSDPSDTNGSGSIN